MSKVILKKAMEAALLTFICGQTEFTICGITLQIQHAHDNNYQVLLPESCGLQEREVFRIFDAGRDSIVIPV